MNVFPFMKGYMCSKDLKTSNTESKSMKTSKRKSKQSTLKSLLENRFIIYAILLVGGIVLDVGVLIVNSECKVTSVSMIVIGSILVLFSLRILIEDKVK